MKTALEILNQVYLKDEHRMASLPFHDTLKFVLDAMEEYAKKEAIEFSMFCLDYDIKNKAHELSTKKLYEIFKNKE